MKRKAEYSTNVGCKVIHILELGGLVVLISMGERLHEGLDSMIKNQTNVGGPVTFVAATVITNLLVSVILACAVLVVFMTTVF